MRMSISLAILFLLPSTLGSTVARLQTNEELLAIINNLKEDLDNYKEEDDTVEPPPDPNPVSAFGDGPMPDSFELPLVMMYDSTVQASHGYHPSAVEAWVHRVVELTRPRLAVFRPSSIRLNVLRIDNWPGTFKVGTKVILNLARNRSDKKDLTMLLVGPAQPAYKKGVAVRGTACREDGTALGMVEDRNNDTETARILAHEIGHTLGIR